MKNLYFWRWFHDPGFMSYLSPSSFGGKDLILGATTESCKLAWNYWMKVVIIRVGRSVGDFVIWENKKACQLTHVSGGKSLKFAAIIIVIIKLMQANIFSWVALPEKKKVGSRGGKSEMKIYRSPSRKWWWLPRERLVVRSITGLDDDWTGDWRVSRLLFKEMLLGIFVWTSAYLYRKLGGFVVDWLGYWSPKSDTQGSWELESRCIDKICIPFTSILPCSRLMSIETIA